MLSVIRANGETFYPPHRHFGSGRPGKYPFEFLEVGDHFVAPHEARASLNALISQGKKFGRGHELQRGYQPGTYTITRTK